MSVKLEFVDTNVLLYALDHTEETKQAQAEVLLERLWSDHNGCLSVQVLQFYVNATRKLSEPLDPDAARQVIEDYSLWIVHAPGSASVLAAVDISRQHQVSFWDALILGSAFEVGAGVVWSEDLNAGQHFDGLVVQTPFRS